MHATAWPDQPAVATRAAAALSRIKTDAEYPELIDGCVRYNNDWTCTAGTLTINNWDVRTDAEPLLEEALRVLVLKSAVFELTSDEVAAELPVPRPVDEVFHAILAQRGLTERMATRQQVSVVHSTPTEQKAPAYEPGCYTSEVYTRAFGEQPPARYWFGGREHTRRAEIIRARLSVIGLHDLGLRHGIDFDELPDPLLM